MNKETLPTPQQSIDELFDLRFPMTGEAIIEFAKEWSSLQNQSLIDRVKELEKENERLRVDLENASHEEDYP